MIYKKIRILQLTLFLFLGIVLISCKKENLNNFQEIQPSIPSDNPTTKINLHSTKNLIPSSSSNSTPSHQIVLEMEKAIRELTIKSLIQTAFYPQVYGFDNGSATVRTGCPSSSLATDNQPSGVVHTITLDYAPNCSTPSNDNYEGTIVIIINGELNIAGTTVKIELADNFKVNSTNDLDGIMSFIYFDNGTEQRYDISNILLDNTNITNSNVSTLSLVDPALNGHFLIKPNTIGDPGNTLDIINDTIAYQGCFVIDSPDEPFIRSCTTEDIYFSIPCGSPFDGEIILDTLNNDGTYGSGNASVGSFGNLNFAYPNSINYGACDKLVQFTDNVTDTTLVINL
jgi:hypothetical protein